MASEHTTDEEDDTNLEDLASSRPIPLISLSSRAGSRNKGLKNWKPFQFDNSTDAVTIPETASSSSGNGHRRNRRSRSSRQRAAMLEAASKSRFKTEELSPTKEAEENFHQNPLADQGGVVVAPVFANYMPAVPYPVSGPWAMPYGPGVPPYMPPYHDGHMSFSEPWVGYPMPESRLQHVGDRRANTENISSGIHERRRSGSAVSTEWQRHASNSFLARASGDRSKAASGSASAADEKIVEEKDTVKEELREAVQARIAAVKAEEDEAEPTTEDLKKAMRAKIAADEAALATPKSGHSHKFSTSCACFKTLCASSEPLESGLYTEEDIESFKRRLDHFSGKDGKVIRPPPGLPTPKALKKLDRSPYGCSQFEIQKAEEANHWFQTDNRGERKIRQHIAEIAEAHAEECQGLDGAAQSAEDAERSKQMNLLLGDVIANLHSYVSDDRPQQADYFANFGDVSPRYCEPVHGGRRSYFDRDPAVDQWRLPVGRAIVTPGHRSEKKLILHRTRNSPTDEAWNSPSGSIRSAR